MTTTYTRTPEELLLERLGWEGAEHLAHNEIDYIDADAIDTAVARTLTRSIKTVIGSINEAQGTSMVFDPQAWQIQGLHLPRGRTGQVLLENAKQWVPENDPEAGAALEYALRSHWARQEARRLEGTTSLAAHPLDIRTLTELLALPPEPQARIQGIIPWEANTLLAAMRKTGKTTFLLNLAFSLITGEPFLGTATTRPIEGNIAFLNYELQPHTFARWANDIGVNQDRLHILNLRGQPNPLGNDTIRADAFIRELQARSIETVIVDPFAVASRPVVQNENDANTRGWLEDAAALCRQGGALDFIIADHMGKGSESARGSSAKEDWADSIIYLTRDREDDDGTRYLRAEGRDVNFTEDALSFDADSRHLTLTGTGSRSGRRQESSDHRLGEEIIDYFQKHPEAELSGNELRKQIGGRAGVAARVAQGLAREGILSERAGPRNSRMFSLRQPPKNLVNH